MRAALLALSAFVLAAVPHAGSAAADTASRDSFVIVSEDASETSRVVSVRIERRLASTDLARIAQSVRDANPNPNTRHTVVSFYLPRMPADQRPWASVDTTPVPKVVIGGLRVEDEKLLAAEVAADRRSLIGAWLTELPASPGRISIINNKGKVHLEWAMRNGQLSLDEVIATRGTRGTRFDLTGGGEEYYLLKASGELEHRGKDRLIAVFEPVGLAKSSPLVASSGAETPTSAAGHTAEDDAAGTDPAQPRVATAASPPPRAPARARRTAKVARAKGDKPLSPVVVSDYMRPIH